jgi:undecaprenyl-diphosphatase
MAIWEAALLGVIQGLTEFLPISSTAHLLVARNLLGHDRPEDAFTTVIQLGTLVAVVGYFRADILRLARGFLSELWAGKPGSTPDGRTAWLIILGTIPVVVAGLLLKTWLKATFYTLPAVAVVSIVFALLLAAAEWWAARRQRRGLPARGEEDVTAADAVWVGVWQALALMPGGSRSGSTITGGLFAGLGRAAAARFSFLLSLPAIVAAGAKEVYDERHRLFASAGDAAALAVGLAVSAIVGYLAIAWLLHFLKRYSTAVFILYRLLLGGLILLALGGGWVS